MQKVQFNEILEVAFIMAIMSDPEESQVFHQAWWHPDSQEQEKWRQAIWKELGDMINH